MNGTVTSNVEIHGIKATSFESAKLYLKATPFYKQRGINPYEDKEGFYFQVRQDDSELMVYSQLNKVELGYL